MDGLRFDVLIRTLTTRQSRRVTLSSLTAGVLGLGRALDGTTVQARKKRKKAKKKRSCSAGNPKRCGNRCCRSDETCRAGRCLDHCQDGLLNFRETDTDCGGPCPRRLAPFGTCVLGKRCAVDEDCFTGVCVEATLGAGRTCALCRQDSDCDRNSTSGRRCINHDCFACAADADCPAERQFCIATGACPNNEPCVCGSCRQDTDCPPGQVCDEQGQCFECFEDTDCTRDASRPVCVENVCRQCARDADCPTAGDLCIQHACRTPATCPAGRDLCTQGFVAETVCGDGCRCHTTTDSGTRCVGALEPRCDAQPSCTSRTECEARHGPGAFCVQDTGTFCGCRFCALQCA